MIANGELRRAEHKKIDSQLACGRYLYSTECFEDGTTHAGHECTVMYTNDVKSTNHFRMEGFDTRGLREFSGSSAKNNGDNRCYERKGY